MYREYKELKYLAYHDSLTGLFNRNWLNKNIDQIKAKYVYFIDINDLHKINENGHTFGDEYIKKAVATIKHSGTFIRYAGDEFILFSDLENEVDTNELFSVGCTKVSSSILKAIQDSDLKMIESKRLYKLNVKPIEGATIVAYGQEVKIAEVVTIKGKHRIYLEHPIVVPTKEYTRDYISEDEIQRYIDF